MAPTKRNRVSRWISIFLFIAFAFFPLSTDQDVCKNERMCKHLTKLEIRNCFYWKMGGTDTCEETQLFVRLGLIDQIDIEGN